MIIRSARLDDALRIGDLVSLGEREGQLLPRSLDAIRASIGDWIVAEETGSVIGCGSLVEMGPALSEIRSLVVAPQARHKGTGALLVRALAQEANARKIPVVFALTRAVAFFERLGFYATVREDFPEKVWRDCVMCPVRDACDETAVVLPIEDRRWAVAGTPRLQSAKDAFAVHAE